MNKFRKFFALSLSIPCMSMSSVCANPSIIKSMLSESAKQYFLKYFDKNGQLKTYLNYPSGFNSRVACQFASILQKFAKRFDYVEGVDSTHVVTNACNTGYACRTKITSPNIVYHPAKSKTHSYAYTLDRNVLNHSPGFSSWMLHIDGSDRNTWSDEKKLKLDKLKTKPQLEWLIFQLNCILIDKAPRLNTLVLGAVLYAAAIKAGSTAFLVYKNTNPDKFNVQAETSVIIKTGNENFVITFKPNKTFSYLNLHLTDEKLPSGSSLYFSGETKMFEGLHKDWNLKKEMSVHELINLIKDYKIFNEEYRKHRIEEGRKSSLVENFNFSDFAPSWLREHTEK